ncbi:MAG: hypothetical protein V8T91_00260 [Ruminococcus sp.]
MPILEFQHVSKVYHNSTKALDDLSFSVEEGEILSIIAHPVPENQRFFAVLIG